MNILVDTMTPEIENVNLEKKGYYEFMYTESVSSLSIYNKFLNWVSGEFVLCLQDWEKGLKIFFPSGSLYIELLENSHDRVDFKIVVKAKNKLKATNANTAVYNVLNHLLKFN